MSSIRPLITITVLVVVGVVLYVKINEGTPRPAPGADDTWNEPDGGVPPLATSSVAPATSDGAAPAWPATPVAPASNAPLADAPPLDVAATTNAAAAATTVPAGTPSTPLGPAAETSPTVPPVPAVPEIAAAAQPEATTPVVPPLPTALPANVPEARYPDQAAAIDPAALPTAPAVAPTADVPPVAAAAATSTPENTLNTAPQAAATPEQVNAAAAVITGIPSTPAPLDANPLRSSAATAASDPYSSGAATTDPAATPAPTTPVEQSFVNSWPAIQALLDRGELTEAHKQLSKWYGDPSLTPTDAERVDTLLSQLAGTVVYSTEHRLAPAHVVKQGETLETIATQYNVPWQLLAKINGVAAADQVRPGQELKVMRGPFSAVVDLSRSQLTLMVDDRYAGKFPVSVQPGQTINDGEWVVGKKSNEQAPGRALLLQGNAAAPGAPAPQLVIASDAIQTSSADGTVIKVAAKDADELSDILSIGSRVVTRR